MNMKFHIIHVNIYIISYTVSHGDNSNEQRKCTTFDLHSAFLEVWL
jgi:hypothetical protein